MKIKIFSSRKKLLLCINIKITFKDFTISSLHCFCHCLYQCSKDDDGYQKYIYAKFLHFYVKLTESFIIDFVIVILQAKQECFTAIFCITEIPCCVIKFFVDDTDFVKYFRSIFQGSVRVLLQKRFGQHYVNTLSILCFQ